MNFFKKFSNRGPVVMLNLLKFKEFADYSASMSLAPKNTISGKEAYQIYIDETMPFLKEAGSEIIFMGAGGDYVIGPLHEGWDMILLVRHKSVSKFIEFSRNEGYQEIAGHRKAALLDSRLLPSIEKTFSVD